MSAAAEQSPEAIVVDDGERRKCGMCSGRSYTFYRLESEPEHDKVCATCFTRWLTGNDHLIVENGGDGA